MYYYLLIAIQLFCAYHAYKNQKHYYWFFVIIFLPLIGCIIYIITQMYTKNDVDRLQKDITKAINPTKEIRDLEERVQFSDSYANRIALADAYFEIGNFNNAISHYEFTLADTVQDDFYAKQQLIICYFKIENFSKVASYAETILKKSDFKGSPQQFCYGMALNALGKNNEAEIQLQQINKPYSNYNERLTLAKFYLEHGKAYEAKIVLQDIFEESQHMTKPNKRLFKNTIIEVQSLLKSM